MNLKSKDVLLLQDDVTVISHFAYYNIVVLLFYLVVVFFFHEGRNKDMLIFLSLTMNMIMTLAHLQWRNDFGKKHEARKRGGAVYVKNLLLPIFALIITLVFIPYYQNKIDKLYFSAITLSAAASFIRLVFVKDQVDLWKADGDRQKEYLVGMSNLIYSSISFVFVLGLLLLVPVIFLLCNHRWTGSEFYISCVSSIALIYISILMNKHLGKIINEEIKAVKENEKLYE